MQNNSILPNEGYVRLSTILKVIPVCKSTWWQGVKSGRYPEPVRTLGKRITAWRAEDIRAFLESHSEKEGGRNV